MLSRAAENLFWMGRYVERACNVARLLDMNYYLSLDFEEQYVQWEPFIQITGDHAIFKERHDSFSADTVMHFLLLDADYLNSAISALRMARENARAAREYLPLEFWEELNRIHVLLGTYAQRSHISPSSMQRLCARVIETGRHLQGICEDSMWHGEGYQFYKLGVWLERADKTSRFLHAKYFYLLPTPGDVGSALDDLHWAAVLHSLAGLDIYHRQYGLVTPAKVIAFTVLDRHFPRSISFCLQRAVWCLQAISQDRSAGALEAIAGLLEWVNRQDGVAIIIGGLHEFINQFQFQLNLASDRVQLDFF